jgi:hypothetical protein
MEWGELTIRTNEDKYETYMYVISDMNIKLPDLEA